MTPPERIVEQALLFGGERALCGILTRGKAPEAPLAYVILNTGIAHRVGHHRMYVALARRLARRGHASVRFDFAGIGDSPVQTDKRPPHEANLDSIRDVINWIEGSLGISRIVLVGICSGADHAALYSGTDRRVVGAVLVDPSIPRTRRFFVNDTMQRLKSRRFWLNLLRGRGNVWALVYRRLGISRSAGGPAEPFSRPDLEQPEAIAFLERTYQGIVDAGVEILAVFTGGHSFQHNYRTQIFDALPNVSFGDRIELVYLADCDHTFSFEGRRQRLYALIERWQGRHLRDPAGDAREAGPVAEENRASL